jgi:adenylosuccinate synthase
MSRVGVRVQDLFDEKILCQKVEPRSTRRTSCWSRCSTGARSPSTRWSRSSVRTPSGCARTSPTPRSCSGRALDAGRTVLLEGGQATLLDVDHGTYPFVTSSNATAAGVHRCRRAADPDRPGDRGRSRPTRRASGPDRSRRAARRRRRAAAPDGAEFGTTTGRPAACGWYDAPIARFAARINGVTDFVLTKLDVLTGWERIPVCVAYDVDGVRHDELPVTQTEFHHAKPVYEELPGWDEDISGRPVLRRPAGGRAGLRARARGDVRRADERDRRGPGSRPDRRRTPAALTAGTGAARPRLVSPQAH